MDGPHDLGGRQGFGPVDTAAPPFRHEWEKRQFALTTNTPRHAASIDAWRHGIERMDPATYLTVPYFVKWCLNGLAMMVASGRITLDEAVAGHAAAPVAPPAPRDVEGGLAYLRTMTVDFARPAPAPARFAEGERVRTSRHGKDGHTRLPGYARGAEGRILAARGGFLYADDCAEGRETVAHLYTVEFAAPELWGPDADPRDSVLLDLWEPYLEPA